MDSRRFRVLKMRPASHREEAMVERSETGASRVDYMEQHLRRYLASDGADGHYEDFTVIGGKPNTPTLILKTIGRQSGQEYLAPLIYGQAGDEYVIVASKGGFPKNPGWFHNLTARPDVTFQVGGEKFRGSWRLAEGAERQKIWDYMSEVYPPYPAYQAATDRQIPVVLLRPKETVAAL